LSRILLGRASWGDRVAALRSPDDAPPLEGEIPKGRGLFETTASTARVVQGWYASQPELAAGLARRLQPLDDSKAHELAICHPERCSGPVTVPTRPEDVDVKGISPDPPDLYYGNDKRAPSGQVENRSGNASPQASFAPGSDLPADDWGHPLDWSSPPLQPTSSSLALSDDDWPAFDEHHDATVASKMADFATQEADW
jgi:hypothetical protein